MQQDDRYALPHWLYVDWQEPKSGIHDFPTGLSPQSTTPSSHSAGVEPRALLMLDEESLPSDLPGRG